MLTLSRAATWVVAGVACILVASCAGDGPAPTAASEPAGPFTAAVVRGDGLLVPFATYADGAWTGPESVAGGGTLEYEGMSRAPAWFAGQLDALRSWRVATPLETSDAIQPAGSAATPGDPVDVPSHCQAAWMLESDLPSTSTPEAWPADISGVAFSEDVEVVSAAVLTPNDEEHASALAAIQAGFEAAETAEIERRDNDGNYGPRTVGAAAAKVPLTITNLYRVGGGPGVSLYAFEARRTYAAAAGSGEADCDEATVMTGWLSENASGELALIPGASTVQMTNCLFEQSPLIEPLGAAVVDGRTFVVVVNHGYEGESYSIHEVSPAEARELVTVGGGGC